MNLNRDTETRISAKEISFVLCIILFAFVIRIPSLTQPLGPDQSIMAVIGEGILGGELPYRDYWEMGSPAIFFTYALMFKIFGLSMAAIPITDAVISMLTVFLVFLLARSIWNAKVGYISALFFAFFSNGIRLGMHAGGDIAFGTFWYIAQRESFMLPLVVAAFYFILKTHGEKIKFWQLLISGFLSGLAFVYKFPSLVIFICLILYLNVSVFSKKGGLSWKRHLSKNLILIFGFVLALVPFTLFFIAKGAMQDMTGVIFKYVFSVYGQIERNYLGIFKMGLVKTLFIAKENFVLWIFALTSSIYILKNDRRKENLLVVGWAIASVIFVVSHREFFGYHYLFLLPVFSLMTGYGFVLAMGNNLRMRQIFSSDFARIFVVFALAANLVFFATLNFMHYTKFYYYITKHISQEEYYAFFNAYPKHDYSFSADYKVSQFIKNNTDHSDMIYVIGGIEGGIYFLTKRKSPSRFIFSWFLFSPIFGQVRQAKAYRAELLDDLVSNKPKYIVTIHPLESIKEYTGIYGFVKNNYVLEKIFPDDRFVYVLDKNVNKKS